MEKQSTVLHTQALPNLPGKRKKCAKDDVKKAEKRRLRRWERKEHTVFVSTMSKITRIRYLPQASFVERSSFVFRLLIHCGGGWYILEVLVEYEVGSNIENDNELKEKRKDDFL